MLPRRYRKIPCRPRQPLDVPGGEDPAGDVVRRRCDVELGFRGVPEQMPQIMGDFLRRRAGFPDPGREIHRGEGGGDSRPPPVADGRPVHSCVDDFPEESLLIRPRHESSIRQFLQRLAGRSRADPRAPGDRPGGEDTERGISDRLENHGLDPGEPGNRRSPEIFLQDGDIRSGEPRGHPLPARECPDMKPPGRPGHPGGRRSQQFRDLPCRKLLVTYGVHFATLAHRIRERHRQCRHANPEARLEAHNPAPRFQNMQVRRCPRQDSNLRPSD